MIVLVSPKTQKIDTKNANFLAEIITKLLPENIEKRPGRVFYGSVIAQDVIV